MSFLYKALVISRHGHITESGSIILGETFNKCQRSPATRSARYGMCDRVIRIPKSSLLFEIRGGAQ